MKALRTASLGATGCFVFFVGSRDIWFEYDTKPSECCISVGNSKVEIPQEGLGKSSGT